MQMLKIELAGTRVAALSSVSKAKAKAERKRTIFERCKGLR